jgi:hypothetical protein
MKPPPDNIDGDKLPVSTSVMSDIRHDLRRYIHAFSALIGCLCFWVGLYNLIDLYLFVSWWPLQWINDSIVGKDWPTLVMGLSMLTMTDSLLCEGAMNKTEVFDDFSFFHMAKLYLRSLLAYIGSAAYWVGAWNIVDYHTPGLEDETFARDLALCAVGFFLLMISRTVRRYAGVTGGM